MPCLVGWTSQAVGDSCVQVAAIATMETLLTPTHTQHALMESANESDDICSLRLHL